MKSILKRCAALLFVFVITVSVLAGCTASTTETSTATTSQGETTAATTAAGTEGTTASGKPMKMVMITDAGGLGDKGFNDIAWAGMEKARDELGYQIDVIESTEAAQYGPNIAAAAEQGYDIVVCVGYLFVDVIAEVAPQYPDTKFIMIDGDVKGDNVYSYKFDVEQASYLAGALAGLVIKEGKFGYVGGMEIPDVLAWESGYVTGVKTTQPDAEVVTSYVGSFADPGKAKELALAQFNAGASVCMEVTSGGSIGVIEAARDSNKKFIACDNSKDSLAPGFELTAALAKRDEAIFAAAKMIKEGTAVAGTTFLTIKDGIFALPDNVEKLYGSEVKAKIDKLTEMLKSGEIVVPKTREDVKTFKYPEI